jgi:multiple sugar transport system substrate-binding protein
MRRTLPSSLFGVLNRITVLGLAALALAGCAQRPEKPTLNVWIGDWNEDTRKLLDETVIPEFERKHNVIVKVQYIDWAHLDEKLTVTFAGGVQPDIFQIGAEYVGSMAYRGQAEILDRYVKSWPQAKDFIPASWQTCVANGHVFGLPYLSAPRLLVYRKDLFQKAGLKCPPVTWNDWVASGEALTQRNDRGMIVRAGINAQGGWQDFIALLWENGGDILTPDGKHAAFNSPAGVEALQYYVELFSKHNVCPREGIPSAGMNVPLFAAGQSAQEITNQITIKDVIKYSKDFSVKDVGVCVPPWSKKPTVAVYTDWLAMSPQCRQKDLAWELMKHLTRPDNLIAYNETQYFIPPIRSAASSAYVRNTPFMRDFLREMDLHGRSLPPIPEWFEMRAGLRTAVDAAVYQTKTPKQALGDYAAQVDKLIAQRERTGR